MAANKLKKKKKDALGKTKTKNQTHKKTHLPKNAYHKAVQSVDFTGSQSLSRHRFVVNEIK